MTDCQVRILIYSISPGEDSVQPWSIFQKTRPRSRATATRVTTTRASWLTPAARSSPTSWTPGRASSPWRGEASTGKSKLILATIMVECSHISDILIKICNKVWNFFNAIYLSGSPSRGCSTRSRGTWWRRTSSGNPPRPSGSSGAPRHRPRKPVGFLVSVSARTDETLRTTKHSVL